MFRGGILLVKVRGAETECRNKAHLEGYSQGNKSTESWMDPPGERAGEQDDDSRSSRRKSKELGAKSSRSKESVRTCQHLFM